MTSFGAEPRPSLPSAALRVLAGKRALLVLDGTEDTDDLRAVLAVRGGCGVLVTSRARQDALAERQDLDPLESGDAVALLRKWSGEQKETPPATAEAICQLVGRLPLAVRLAGRYLSQTGETPAEYLAWLRETPLDALNEGARREQSVRVLLDKSLDQVSARARQVLAVVGLLALAPFRRAPLAAALEASPNALRKPLGELMRYGLLTRDEAEYAVSHALVHTYARTCCVPESEAVARLAAYYDTLAREECAKGLSGYRRLDTERVHLMRVLDGCIARERWAAARSLVWAVRDYLDLQGYWTEQATALELGIQAAQAEQARYDESAFLNSLGLAYADLGQVERAIDYYKQALAIRREIGDRRGEGNDLGNLGNAYADLGQVERARECLQQALAIFEEIKSPYAEQARGSLEQLDAQ